MKVPGGMKISKVFVAMEDKNREKRRQSACPLRGMAFFSTSEEEKRREVETVADSTDSERTRLPHGRYFEVPTFSRWSFALYLAL